jgi:hypothetical protein
MVLTYLKTGFIGESLLVLKRKQASNKAENLPNLSILLSSGKERNIDYHSIGEKSGKSPNLKSLVPRYQRIVV